MGLSTSPIGVESHLLAAGWQVRSDAQTRLSYDLSCQAWYGYPRLLHELITRRRLREVCELGGGANPALTPSAVQELDVVYTLLDVSPTELAKAPEGYQCRVADIAADNLPQELIGRFDLVHSRMLAEHIVAPETFHRNAYRLLRPGGIAVHFFPTLFSPPFVLNWLLPEWLTRYLLPMLQPLRHAAGKHGKFPAYYRWCTGPTQRSLKRLRNIGFIVEQYTGYFGHSGNATKGRGYYDAIPFLARLHERSCQWLVKHPLAFLTSYSIVVLRKPE